MQKAKEGDFMQEKVESIENSIFAEILDENETVQKIFKPNKTKFMWSAGVLSFFYTFYLYIMAYVTIWGSQLDAEGNFNASIAPIVWFVPAICLAVQIVLTIVFAHISYKNRYYAYTESRILIRSGIFGIDFQSLEMKSIGAINVSVSLLDKLVAKHTGTVVFGSNSSPVGFSQKAVSTYRFANVVSPYDLSKEIKSKIKSAREEQK